MQQGNTNKGLSKHRKAGHSNNSQHFTGKKSGKRKTRKGKGLSRKQRLVKKGSHKNKYRNQ